MHLGRWLAVRRAVGGRAEVGGWWWSGAEVGRVGLLQGQLALSAAGCAVVRRAALPVGGLTYICAACPHICAACPHRHGRGKYSFNAYRYEGEWRQDRQHGAGACVTEAGDRYVGECRMCHRWLAGGERALWLPPAMRACPALPDPARPPAGEFAEGKRHGRGRCLYADGSKYEGVRAAGPSLPRVLRCAVLCCGPSSCRTPPHPAVHPVACAGEWQDDVRHGQGTCLFASGDKYQGAVQGWGQCAVLVQAGVVAVVRLARTMHAQHPAAITQASGRPTSGTVGACAGLPMDASSGVSAAGVSWGVGGAAARCRRWRSMHACPRMQQRTNATPACPPCRRVAGRRLAAVGGRAAALPRGGAGRHACGGGADC